MDGSITFWTWRTLVLMRMVYRFPNSLLGLSELFPGPVLLAGLSELIHTRPRRDTYIELAAFASCAIVSASIDLEIQYL